MRMPDLSDSSRSSAMSSILPSCTSSAMRSSSSALFTWYGSSVTTMDWRPRFSSVSISTRARTYTRPRPVR